MVEPSPMNTDEFRRQMWAHETEKTFQTRVINIAKAFGWGPIYHTQVSIHSVRGYPDLHMLRGERSLFAELKTMRGKVSPDQQMWVDALAAASHEAYIWRPSDEDAITEILSRGEGARLDHG